jgi:hypothetical protein
MTDQHTHRATTEQWEHIERHSGGLAGYSAVRELRSRVEALEATHADKLDRLIAMDRDDPTPDAAMTELRAASAEARPAGLVEQVSKRIEYGIDAEQDPEGIARATIREVAAWLRSVGNNGSADELEQQGNHG